jgi:Ca-activated chloride channel family protein
MKVAMAPIRRQALALVPFAIALCCLAWPGEAAAQAGVLIPSSESDQPDEAIVQLTEMTVSVEVDRQVARTRVVQIFANRIDQPIEATYIFAIPTTAAIADFAVWDGDTRIPGVILEKKRARKLYEEIAARAIDPGLLEQEDAEESTTAFKVRVAPVPANGTKRLELEYTEVLALDELEAVYSFPLKPSEYGQQSIGHLRIDVTINSGFPLTEVLSRGAQFKLAQERREESFYRGRYEGVNVTAGEDFAFTFGMAIPESRLDVIAYRAPERISVDELRDPRLAERQPDGYFQATAAFNHSGGTPGGSAAAAAPRSIVLMLDTSLSMSGEKLDRAFEAVQHFLGGLTPADQFNLLLFNDDIVELSPQPLAATPDQIERALAFVRAGYLSGGTDLSAALERGFDAAARLAESKGGRALVLVTDGNPTLSTTSTKRILETAKRRAPEGVRVSVFGVGSDTRLALLGELAASTRGQFAWARETEDISFRLRGFFNRVGRLPIDGLSLAVDGGEPYHVYPDTTTGFDRSATIFVGRYKRPGPASFTVTGTGERGPVRLSVQAALPERDESHGEVPRLWARARVDALLARIELEGESEDLIAEVVALSKRHKFVTPYTSFLAAPRSLLRPRAIRPGDPVVRVQADPSIRAVVAVFPFGLVKQLRPVGEGTWETRFLAPQDLADGQYVCRLILTDDLGRSIEEHKRFRIDSRPPQLNANVWPEVVEAGREATVTVRADADTRWIAARLFGGAPVPVRWSATHKANVGTLPVPAGLAPGVYTIYVTAEDFARNGAVTEVQVEVR